jgi:hypothetical protein
VRGKSSQLRIANSNIAVSAITATTTLLSILRPPSRLASVAAVAVVLDVLPCRSRAPSSKSRAGRKVPFELRNAGLGTVLEREPSDV